MTAVFQNLFVPLQILHKIQTAYFFLVVYMTTSSGIYWWKIWSWELPTKGEGTRLIQSFSYIFRVGILHSASTLLVALSFEGSVKEVGQLKYLDCHDTSDSTLTFPSCHGVCIIWWGCKKGVHYLNEFRTILNCQGKVLATGNKKESVCCYRVVQSLSWSFPTNKEGKEQSD